MSDYELMQIPSKIDAMIKQNKKVLDESIDEYEIRIGTEEEKPNDRYYLKLSKNKFRLVKQIDKEFSNFRFMNLIPYELPSEIETKINELKPMLMDNQALKLKKIVNDCLKSNNKTKKEKIEKTAKNVQKLIKQLGWETKVILLDHNYLVFLNTAIDMMEDEKLKELQYKLFVYPVEDSNTISYNQTNLKELRDNLCHFIQILKEETEADFTPLINFLEKMENKVTKETKIQVKDNPYRYASRGTTEIPEFNDEDINESATSSLKYEKMMQRTRRN